MKLVIAIAFFAGLSACKTSHIDQGSSLKGGSLKELALTELQCSQLEVEPGYFKYVNPNYDGGRNKQPKHIKISVEDAISKGVVLLNPKYNGGYNGQPETVICRNCNDIAVDGQIEVINFRYNGGSTKSSLAADEANKANSVVLNKNYNGDRNGQPKYIKCTDL